MQAASRAKQAAADLPMHDAMERVGAAEQLMHDARARLDAAEAAKAAAEQQLQAAQTSGDPQATSEARTALSDASEQVCWLPFPTNFPTVAAPNIGPLGHVCWVRKGILLGT